MEGALLERTVGRAVTAVGALGQNDNKQCSGNGVQCIGVLKSY